MTANPGVFGHDGGMPPLPRSGAARTAKLASLPLGFAGRAAAGLGKRLAGQSSEQVNAELAAKAAQQVFNVLGELKGGAMKLGQALSVFEAAVPDHLAAPYREALTKLQRDAPPIAPHQVHAILDQQLGSKWRERFRHFDDTPVAAASIGQVHRATWSDGRSVAVKIQYPGADEALRSDLRQIGRLAPLFKPFAPGADIKALVTELTDRAVEELDYRLEADNQRRFAAAYAGHPAIAVPGVVASSPKVTVTEWMEGTPLAQVIAAGTPGQRDAAGNLLAEFHFSAPALAGLLHVDPHPGNFMLLPDGRLGVIDFGAVLPLPGGIPEELVHIGRMILQQRFEDLVGHMVAAGYALERMKPSTEDIAAVLEPLTEPLRVEAFWFTRDWMRQMAARYTDWRGSEFQTARGFTMPAHYMMVHRVLIGTVAILCQLDARASIGAVVQRWAPQMLEDQPATA